MPSILEQAGVTDPLKVFEGIHISEAFLRSYVLDREDMDPAHVREIEGHFRWCDKCVKRKESFLPLNASEEK